MYDNTDDWDYRDDPPDWFQDAIDDEIADGHDSWYHFVDQTDDGSEYDDPWPDDD